MSSGGGDWLDEMLASKAKQDQEQATKQKQRERAASYADGAFRSLCDRLNSDIERFSGATGQTVEGTRVLGSFTIHKRTFPAFNLELCRRAHLLTISTFQQASADENGQKIDVEVEVVGGDKPGQYRFSYQGVDYADVGELSGAILGPLFAVLLNRD